MDKIKSQVRQLKNSFPAQGPLGPPRGALGTPGAPQGPLGGPGAHGAHGPHGAQCSKFSIVWKNCFQKKRYPRIQNVNFGGENQSCSRRNSAHFGTHTVPWGPLFDHFPGFNNFDKIGVPGSIPHVCFFLGFSGAAQSFFRGKNRPFPKLNRGTLDFYICLTIFDDFCILFVNSAGGEKG